MGHYDCDNDACHNEMWSSKHICLDVYVDKAKDLYHVPVYGQECEHCKELGIMHIHEQSYVDRVVYRVRVEYGQDVPRLPFSRKKKPHVSKLCEARKYRKIAGGVAEPSKTALKTV